jgi:transposase InsO family protein
LGAMDSIAAHCDGYSPRCSCTIRTARSRTSAENLFDLFIAPFSQELEPPPNPGRFNQQTFVDTYSKVAFAKLYDRKTPLPAADLLNDRVVPFFDSFGIPLLRVLTDRGTEYCGNPEHHEYELYLAIENIDHTRTKARSPQTNGIVERLHKTMLNEFYRVTFRKKIYESINALQTDLDAWLDQYNNEREHQGRWCYGKTPMRTFLDSLELAKEKLIPH